MFLIKVNIDCTLQLIYLIVHRPAHVEFHQ
jgi:hypothetical protein